jgi:hypothetical protein
MASRLVVERVALKTLQRHHHTHLNTFGDQETLVDAIGSRPGFFGPNPVAYLSLCARRPGILMDDLDEALCNDRTLIRASAFRGSLFLLNTQDYSIYFRTFHNLLFQRGLQRLALEKITKAHLLHFADILKETDPHLPLSVIQVMDIIFPSKMRRPNQEICSRILQKLCDMGILVRALAKGWKGNDFTYALVKKWLPELSLKPDNPETARTETIRRYLRAYGPASIEDIAWWSGLPIIQCQRSIAHLKREAVRFNVETYRNDMIALKETVDNLKKRSITEEEIQILPPWDPYTLGWRCRRRIADKEILPFIYDMHGNATSVIVDVGKVIGIWQFRDHEVNKLEYHVFEKYKERNKAVQQKIDLWSRNIIKLTRASSFTVIERPLPEPLTNRPDGSFLWPLGKTLITPSGIVEEISPMERRTSNTFRQRYLDNEYLVRSNEAAIENKTLQEGGLHEASFT